ncbi:MBG domain-containing protein [Caulobacter endophyticus]|uniref:MBG domain-containing protein n=1 Tax=Caulobacter endophyticus TaxID=2172652 RepID=UPI002410543F|nr:MBG domain-containing protein [Caulobacter endophyticus]MDG2527911.1 MBG domain-containing protein [Caulobacter endophyticus]
MTQSPTLPRTASRPQRRTKLLAASALCGVAAMLVEPALAQTLPTIPGAGDITVSSGGSQPVISYPDAITLQIQLNASRTVINWSSLHVSNGDTMDFLFNAASDIVLNKTTSQIAIDNGGTVTGKVGAATGGNIWFYSPQGVIVSPGATMSAGGFVFAGGTGLIDANFVNAADPTAVLRAASNAMIRMNTLSSATSASIDAAGNVLLSASSGALSVQTVYGATALVSTTSGSITASEVTTTSGAATVTAGGPGATVTQITGATGVTVSSANNSSVGAATTTTSGDILITSNGSASLTLGDSAGDLTLSAPQVFLSTVDAIGSVYVTGTTQAYVTNRIFAGDDVEITADGNVTAGGAYIKTSGTGADDSHILIRSTNGSASGGTLLTQGTGSKAGDITVSGATSATLTTGVSSRDLTMSGASIGVNNATAARDITLTASNGSATITTSATAGDDLEVTATGGDVLASAATLKSTGVGAADDAHVTARSTTGAVTVGSAVTQGGGGTAGDILIEGSTGATLGSASSTRNLTWTGGGDLALTGNYSAAGAASLTSATGEVNQTAGVVTASSLTANAAMGVSLGGDNMIDQAGNVQTLTGDVLLNNAKALTVAGDVAGRDITVTTTAGDLTVNASTQVVATRNLVLTGETGLIANTGAGGLLSAGGDATLTATTGDVAAISLSSGGSALVQALSGRATLRSASMTGGGDLTISATGAAILGADTPLSIGASDRVSRTGGVGTINVASSGGDAVVFLDSLTGGGLTSVTASNTVGTAWIRVDGGFDVGVIEGFSAYLDATNGTINATNVTLGGGDYTAQARDWAGAALNPSGTIRNLTIIDTDGGLVLGSALTATGNLRLESYDILTSAYDLTAGGDVTVMAAGDIDLASAAAGDDITMQSSGGQAILRKADLTGVGSGRDLSITAAGDAVLGDPDYLAITSDNLFTRSGGGTGTAQIKSINGEAMAHLDASAAIDLLEGESASARIMSGPATFGTITARTGDATIEVLGGAMTIGTATAANGYLDLYGEGGDLTITGSAHGASGVTIQTDGLLDGSLASLISSDGDLDLIGDAVNVGELTAAQALTVGALNGDATVRLAKAGSTVQVISLYGDAALRGAEAPDGVAVVAAGAGTATFGADDKASITTANYVDTNAASGGLGGLNVISYDGDAVVNINSATNGVALVGAAIDGSATVVQKTGDLKIGEIAAYNISIEAMGGTLETGSTVTSGGDYTITAQGFLGDALTPTLFNGVIRDVTITDTLGDLDLGVAAIHADRKLTIAAQDGAVLGQAQLSAGAGLGDGDISVIGQAIALDTVVGDGSVTLDGGTGLVNVATSVTVGGDYVLSGGGFSAAALTPLGAKAGAWTIDDKAGAFDFTGTPLAYGGDITITAVGDVTGGDITSDSGDIRVTAASGQLGALNAASGQVRANASAGGMNVASAKAADLIEVTATTGAARLGAAVLTGTGANSLLVRSTGGDASLGATTPGAATSANLVASAGSSTIVEVGSTTGDVDVNLDRTDTALTTVTARNAARVTVASGALTIGQLTAGAPSTVKGGGETRLVSADVSGDLWVGSTSGALRLGDATPGRVISATGALSLNAAAGITQQGVLRGNTLGVVSGAGVVLLGANDVAHLDTVSVAAGGFAFNDIRGFDIRGPVTATGQTVDLRSGGAIAQTSAGVITAGRLTGSSVGGADFGAANQVAQLGDFTNTGGLFKLVDNRALAIDGLVRSTGTVSLASHGGMSFTANGRVVADGAGDAVILASDGVFTNARGADAVSATNTAGRWLIYTQAQGSPTASTAGNSFNGLAGKSYYGSAYDFSTGTFALAPNAGNRFVYAYQPTLSVTPVSLVVTYNGGVPSISTAITGLINGDAAADAWSGSALASGATSANAGTYALSASGNLTSDLNYRFAYSSGSLRIDPRQVTVTADLGSKPFGQPDPIFGYRITAGALVAGDAFTGALTRASGETPGGYAITRGTLALSANYELTFAGAVFTIQGVPSIEQEGSVMLKHVTQSPDFTLDWDPEFNLETQGQPCIGEGCPAQSGSTASGKVVAALP